MSKIRDLAYAAARLYTMSFLTGNLGEVQEEEDKLICYVKENNIKHDNTTGRSVIHCHGINADSVELAKKFGLNKPITYVFDNINFGKYKAFIYGDDNALLIIKNCNFGMGVSVNSLGTCKISNIHVTDVLLSSFNAHNLEISDIKPDQMNIFTSHGLLKILSDDTVTIKDSNISNIDSIHNIMITSANRVNIINSTLSGDNISIDSVDINIDDDSKINTNNHAYIKVGTYYYETTANPSASRIMENVKFFNKLMNIDLEVEKKSTK